MTRRLAASVARCLLWVWIALAVAIGPGAAQDATSASATDTVRADAQGRPNFEEWERVSNLAQEVIASGQASDQALDDLRSRLLRWRETFLAGQNVNASRIDTLEQQIAALGPSPEGDATEPEEIASRRAALNTQLAEARAPARRSQEAFREADGLAGQIGALLREREADRLLRLDPTPLNPGNWPAAARAIAGLTEVLGNETRRNLASPTQQTALKDNLPLAVVLVVAGLVLIFRAGNWVERIIGRIREKRTEMGAAFRAATFVGSLLAVALPVAGVIAIIEAVDLTGVTGLTGDLLLEVFAQAVVLIAAARWLSLRIFPATASVSPLLNVTPLQAREARFYAVALAVVYAVRLMVLTLSNDSLALSQTFDLSAQSVLRFPLIVIAGVLLFRLGQIVIVATRRNTDPETDDGSPAREEGPARLILRALGRGSCVVGVVAPLLGAIGYIPAASDLVFATVMTVALVGLVAVVQRFVRDIYSAIVRSEQTSAALIPVLLDFAIAIAAIPVLALIWGARLTDLSEAWSYVANGFQIGESRISPLDFLAFVLVFVIGYALTRLVQGALRAQVLPKTKIDVGGQNALVAGTGYVGIFLAALAAITSAGLDLSSLAIVAGALSVGIGFGLQTIVSNFVSGIILLIERPISEGDWIEVGGTMGVVKDISVRATRVETFDRRDVIVPNADLISTSVTNWTKGNLNGRIILPVGVAYGTDTKRVETILREIAEAYPGVILNPPPAILFMNFGADALEFEIRAILRDVGFSLVAKSDMNHAIAKRFAEEGIEIPFAQRDLWLRNPEALVGPKPEDTTRPDEASKPDEESQP